MRRVSGIAATLFASFTALLALVLVSAWVSAQPLSDLGLPGSYTPPAPEPAPAQEPAAPPSAPPNATAAPDQDADQGELLTLACPLAVDLGQPFVVRLTSTKPLLEVTVHCQGQDVTPSISVWNDKHVAIALLGTDALADKPGPLDLAVTANVAGERKAFERTVQVRPVEFQTVALDPAGIPPAKDPERLAAERAALAKALGSIGPERFWTLPFERPVGGKEGGAEGGEIATPYGVLRQAGDTDLGPHRGLEFLCTPGEDVLAVAGGRVVLVSDHLYSGRVVAIDHGLGVVSLYFHLSASRVTKGQQVRRGDVLGQAMVQGPDGGPPRLFLAVSVLGRMVDPEPLLNSNADQLIGQ